MLLQKTDSLGQTQFAKFIGSPYESEAYSVKQTTDSGYILTGYTTNDNTYQHYVSLVKTDINGDTTWTKQFTGSTLVQAILVTVAKKLYKLPMAVI